MNINKITTSILAACTMTLTSCNFSEDDCPRHGVLRAWADFDKISQTEIPAPADCHLMAFGTRYDDIPSATFSTDTLFWSLPRDTYQFIYYTGNYKTEETCCPFKMKLAVPTTTVDGKECIAYKQPYCSTAMFEREIYYQQTTDAEIIPTQFVQRINLKVNVIGEDQIIEAIHSGLDGIFTSKCVSSRTATGNATLLDKLANIKGTKSWICSNWVFGFNPKEKNLLTLDVQMNEENAPLNEKQTVDLTPILMNNDSPEISVEMDLNIGKELSISNVTTIPDWVDVPEEDLTK